MESRDEWRRADASSHPRGFPPPPHPLLPPSPSSPASPIPSPPWVPVGTRPKLRNVLIGFVDSRKMRGLVVVFLCCVVPVPAQEFPKSGNSPDLNAAENIGVILKTELRFMHMEGKQNGFSREALQSDITRGLKDVEDDTELFKRLFSSYPARIKALRDRGRGMQINCTSESCEELCRPGFAKEECCKHCHPQPLAQGLTSGGEEGPSCKHNGRTYRSGEYFTSNTTGLTPSGRGECVSCTCEWGLVMCKLKKCLGQGNCKSLSREPGDCCPACPDQRFPEDEAPLVTFARTTPKSREFGKDCTYDSDRHYKHGARWNPSMGPFGIMACVVCSCANGVISCRRLKCPSTRCERPLVYLPGMCCPACPKDEEAAVGGKELQASDRFCIPRAAPFLVYKALTHGEDGRVTVQFFFRPGEPGIEGKSIEEHIWGFSDRGIESFNTKDLTEAQFQGFNKVFVLGATSKRNIYRFTKKEKRFYERCKKRCDSKLHRLEAALKLRPASTPRGPCAPHEIQV
ncbi:unnamed protein product [Darwinula stevensoni]|uniref:VWFC domain-containing protein n=1 Tax=Darwinula stevensoni TaxID=69355 RepID=A0A7R8XBN4_9CRUS|nr:unnamed protein product [Darwinula stevensoni]CAG0887941.1 unnamed protein product [Darwinula stevensoni]